jgi:hypothetical protein
MAGQINRGSKLGEYIYSLSCQDDVNTIVEIGTWNGEGSTKCIYDAVVNTNKIVYSLECNKNRVEEAIKNLGMEGPNFHLIHGTITTPEELELMIPELDKFDVMSSIVLKKWLEEDMSWVKLTPNVLNDLPEKIDLYIIDGGVFSGYTDFLKLYKRCCYIILDDTLELKNQRTREFILSHPEEFTVIIDDITDDRGGFLVCKRIELVKIKIKSIKIKE